MRYQLFFIIYMHITSDKGGRNAVGIFNQLTLVQYRAKTR